MSRLSLLRVTVTVLGTMWCAGAVVGQSDTRYSASAPVARTPRPTSSGFAGNRTRTIPRADIGQGFTGQSLNSIALQSARARIPNLGQSTFISSSPIRPIISIGSGLSASAKPFSSFSASPTVSPYLNLFREGLGENDDFNYQTLVRPQLQQQQFNQKVERQNLELFRRLQSISARGPYKNPSGAEGLSPTGHQTVFGYQSHYFPSVTSRQQR